MRILNVVKRMIPGGIESWLMQILRNIDRQRYQLDFLVHGAEPGDFDEEIRSLGSRTIFVPGSLSLRRYPSYLRGLRRVLEEQGPYDVVHAHGGPFYGPVLREAARAGVPIRIIHSHNLQRAWRGGPLRALAGWIGQRMINRYATIGLGCSRDACRALFGPDWEQNPRVKVLYYGIDLAPYRRGDREGVRRELGLSPEDVVVVHVGRFSPVKNHEFIVEIAATMSEKAPNVRFVLIGDGQRRPEIERMVQQAGLADTVIFTGKRSDVPRVLSGMDVFVMPSHHEGLGLVLVEAQAAGLPCLVSRTVPHDVDVVPDLCCRLDLSEGPEAWANRLMDLARSDSVDPVEALKAVEASRFNVVQSVAALVSIYDNDPAGRMGP